MNKSSVSGSNEGFFRMQSHLDQYPETISSPLEKAEYQSQIPEMTVHMRVTVEHMTLRVDGRMTVHMRVTIEQMREAMRMTVHTRVTVEQMREAMRHTKVTVEQMREAVRVSSCSPERRSNCDDSPMPLLQLSSAVVSLFRTCEEL